MANVINELFDPKIEKQIDDYIKKIGEAAVATSGLVDQTKKLIVENEDLGKSADTRKKKREALTKEQKAALKVMKDLDKQQQRITELQDKQAQAVARLSVKNQKRLKELKDEARLEGAAKDSIVRKRAELAKLTKEYDRASGTARTKLAPSIKVLSKEISEAEKATNRHSREVGNYREQMSEALQDQDFFGISLNKINTALTTSAGAVGLAAGVLVGLGKAYVSSARGARDLERATWRIQGVMRRIGNDIADMAGDEGFLDKMLRVLQFGFRGGLDVAISDFEADTRRSIQEMETLGAEQEEKRRATRLREMEELRQIRDDETRTIEERKQANEDLQALIKTNASEATKYYTDLKTDYEGLLKLDKENLELKTSIAALEARIAGVEEESAGYTSEALTNKNALTKEEIAINAKKATEKQGADEREYQNAIGLTKIKTKGIEEVDMAVTSSTEKQILESDKLTQKQIENAEKAAKATIKLEEEKAVARRNIAEQALSYGQQFVQALTNFRIANLQRELDQAEGNEKKQAEIREKIARAEKRQALFDIFVNTAVAVVKALPNIAKSVAVGVIGAAQAAAVVARKIPSFFAGGVHKGGEAMTGELGRELAIGKNGRIALTEDKPNVRRWEAGTTFIPNDVTEQILESRKTMDTEMMLLAAVTSVEKKLDNIKNEHTTFDHKGYHKKVRRGNSLTIIRKKYYN